MIVKVNYDQETGIVKGYYPYNISYSNIPNIPNPIIEISDIEHQSCLGKTMQVIDGKLQQYVSTFLDNQNAKGRELISYYSSDDCWKLILQDDQGNQLIQTLDWFNKILPITSATFYNSKGQLITKTMTESMAIALKTQINLIGVQIKIKKIEINQNILNCKIQSELDLINIKSEFDAIDRIIIL